MRYCMEYLKTENVNLVKDMGMIPYKLYKNHNYDSYVATYKNGEYPYANKEVKGLKMNFIKRIFHSYSLDGVLYILKNGKNIDCLHIFHVTLSSVFYATIYKMVNKQGKIYLKLDCSHRLPDRIRSQNRIGKKLTDYFFHKVDLISAEQEVLYKELKELLPKAANKIINVPNGVDFKAIEDMGLHYDFNEKENIIVNVARIGAEEKRTEVLLEAFSKIPNIENKGWKLKLIGPIENNFLKYIEKYFDKYPNLRDVVIFQGNIEDRKKLYEEYRKSKIFTLTSNCESFGIAFIEAAAFGNVVVSTDVGIAKELVINNNGALVNIDDVEGLALALEKVMDSENLLEMSNKTYDICRKKFNWDIIVENLHKEIENLF
ncbi:glycosyltransferase family 4 protein [Clostridium hydrogeniformans]|uniref:glycosyltransferase family 4 protein n=1 Tax=Clostridium hydrogeniformans TaxID=349933 RepID=UPI00047FB5CF|nr:glycosyltransferase family 4 protein [Clostridium hydrogeniformans]